MAIDSGIMFTGKQSWQSERKCSQKIFKNAIQRIWGNRLRSKSLLTHCRSL